MAEDALIALIELAVFYGAVMVAFSSLNGGDAMNFKIAYATPLSLACEYPNARTSAPLVPAR